MVEDELNTLSDSLGMEELSEEEIQALKEEAIERFDELEGVEFKDDFKNNAEKLESDFDVTRSVLIKNIDRIEKLTGLLFQSIAMQPDNTFLVANATSVISEQNKQLKLLNEIHNKTLVNKQLDDKVNEPKDEKGKGKLPPGLSTE